MQTIVDLPEAQLEALNVLGKARNQTPSESLTEVLANLLPQERPDPAGPLSWKHIDSVDCQRKLRAEWDREWDR